MRIAAIDLLDDAEATTRTGELTVAPFVGEVTVMPAIAAVGANMVQRTIAKRAACFRIDFISAPDTELVVPLKKPDAS